MHAIIVDDNEHHARLAAKIVEHACGDNPDVYTDPFMALRNSMTEHPDLIVTDMMMPKMDGITLLREMRKEGIFAPAIIVSGHLKRVSEKLLPSNHIAAIIPKPFQIEELSKAVIEAIAKNASA
ncbi:MAG: response regulator [Candidatus Lokiarchaeota archaeon]|nr:response regulator [Candidatus Lokiarchaeota archaeon]